jgi:hypothetical protein
MLPIFIAEQKDNPMKLQIEWGRPIQLKDARKDGMIYGLNLGKIKTGTAGVYIFGRRWGPQFEALYVGEASKIRGRIKNHLNDLRLMQYLQRAKAGERLLLVGRIKVKRGQRLNKCLRVAELAMIRHFLSEGHDLANTQGRRIERHEIGSSGQHRKRFFPSLIYLERARAMPHGN